MKKMLLALTMGAIVVSSGQATKAEASFSSDASKLEDKLNYTWSARTQLYPMVIKLDQNKLYDFEQMFEKYLSSKPTVKKPVAEKPVQAKPVVEKPAQPKPVEQKPVVEKPAQPVQEKPATPAQPVAEKPVTPAKPVEQKPVTPAKPVEQKPATPAQPVQEKPATPAQTTAPATSISSIEQQVLTLTNQERAKQGLKPLAADSALMASARAKSTDMSKNNYFSHNSPTLGSPFDQMKARGITYRAAAENIAMGQRTAAEVVQGWMESPGHRQNIMNANYTHIGIGYDANGNYWTQQFIQK